MDPELARTIYDAVGAVPPGRVVTYGQVAELIGRPGAHRVVARALRNCPDDPSLPWHRVVGKRSQARAHISIPDPGGAARQRERLQAEGVVMDCDGRICLRTYGWLPS
ncbi:MAG: MGMT family protein [Myxococcales bacterium]|nr:MGMT family protein [Myxococcales bacterium]MDD9968947.1 MGMT family protein [Myxococcales bacterium]